MKALKAAQRKMVAGLLGLRKLSSETPQAFFMRRARVVEEAIPPGQGWDLLWCRKAEKWHGHIGRDHAGSGTEFLLENVATPAQPAARRADRGDSAVAGRTGTRAPGGVAVRWNQGMLFVEAYINRAAARRVSAVPLP